MSGIEDERLGLEKRRFVRIDIRLKAEFQVGEGDNAESFVAQTKNISHSGACITVFEAKEKVLSTIGDGLPKLRISIELWEEDSRIDAKARTAWIDSRMDWMVRPRDEDAPILMGMAFENFDESDEDVMNTFIADVLTKRREGLLD